MSPVDTAINSVGRAIASFRPQSMPRLSRAHYSRELLAWSLLPAMLGAIEGGVAGVIAKNIFEGVVPARPLNMAVAVLAGAPAFANVFSFVWAAISHGRHKIRFVVALQVTTSLLVALVALAPRSGLGLVVLTVGVVSARVCWSGVITIRSTVWRMNYPRAVRARMAGKLATMQALVLTAVGVIVGAAMSLDQNAFRYLYPSAAVVGLVGTFVYSRLRVRAHRALVRAEQSGGEFSSTLVNPATIWRVLREDRRFGEYMFCMFVFGTGNLMVTAPLIIILRDRFGMAELGGILVTLSIPTLMIPLSIPFWSRLLDRVHIVHFRALHSWIFMATSATFLVAALTDQVWLLFVGAAIQGIAFGGGMLGWNLGHHDFAPRHRASQYMGVHVTLTGVRGLFAPALAVVLYELFELRQPGSGPWVFSICLALNLVGVIWFNRMARRRSRAAAA